MRRIHPLVLGGALAVVAAAAIVAPGIAAGAPLPVVIVSGADDGPNAHHDGDDGHPGNHGNPGGKSDGDGNGRGNGNGQGQGNGSGKPQPPPDGDPSADGDADGVSDADDVCPETDLGGGSQAAPDGTEPNHFWWTGSELTNGRLSFSLDETAGCTVADIIAVAHLGEGQLEAGLAPGQVKRWVRSHS